MFYQLSRLFGSHHNLPWSSIICNNVHRTVHNRFQCTAFFCRSLIFSKTPVVNISICQSSPKPVGQFKSQSSFHRVYKSIDIEMFKPSLRPLLAPCHSSVGKRIFSKIACHFMEYRIRMFREEITESYTLVVCPDFNIEAIL